MNYTLEYHSMIRLLLEIRYLNTRFKFTHSRSCICNTHDFWRVNLGILTLYSITTTILLLYFEIKNNNNIISIQKLYISTKLITQCYWNTTYKLILDSFINNTRRFLLEIISNLIFVNDIWTKKNSTHSHWQWNIFIGCWFVKSKLLLTPRTLDIIDANFRRNPFDSSDFFFVLPV